MIPNYDASVSILRPENTTAYTALDVIGTYTGTSQVETATIVGTIDSPVSQVETAVIVGTITGTGDAEVIVTGARITGSPLTIPVAVLDTDTASVVATKIRAALNLESAITDVYTVGGTAENVTLTEIIPTDNDATLNIAYDNDTCTGLTGDATSADTTAGVTDGTGEVEVVVTAARVTGSPVTVPVAVVAGDTASLVAEKIRIALAANAAIAAIYTVSGATDAVILTEIIPTGNDATLNIAYADGTTDGLTPDATSTDTTAGSRAAAGSAVLEFTNVAPPGGSFIISDVNLRADISAVTAGMDAFRLHLYNAQPAAILDNAAFNLGGTAADRDKYLGFVPLVIPVDLGATLWSENTNVNKKVKCADGQTSIWGVLQTVGGFTPASAEVWNVFMRNIRLEAP